jgi:thiol:disulfide interchange protein DsbC
VNRNRKTHFRFALGIQLVILNFVFISKILNAAPAGIQSAVMRVAQSESNIDFNLLPFNQSIKIIKGNGSKKIAVFYEIDCGYCRYLERYELSQIKNVTVYTFLFTNDENESAVSWKKAESIWCAANVNEAWQDFIFKNDIAINYEACKNPIKENKMLALKLGVKSTPTIIFSNGNKAVGMIKAKDIEQRLLDANFYSN